MEQVRRFANNVIAIGNNVYSYETLVAEIEGDKLIELGKWSRTTSKHVKLVADKLGLTLIKFSK